MDIKNCTKILTNSLKILDNSYVSCTIIFILVLLASTLFSNINYEIKKLLNHNIIRLIIILLIVWIAPKNVTMAILIAIIYCSCIHGYKFEGFKSKTTTEEDSDSVESKSSEKKDTKDKKDKKYEKSASKEDFENKDDEEDIQEDFIPFFMSNNDFEKQYDSGMATTTHKSCLSTDPNQFELVGSACSAVSTFDGELNAQGMNSVMGFNMHQTTSQTAQPI